ncbi:hypothetical protein BSM4216_2164 [Bacillus smithii]|nr:hypothetical protein BSM4216_2164 [Bacillus smithii]
MEKYLKSFSGVRKANIEDLFENIKFDISIFEIAISMKEKFLSEFLHS